MADEDTPIPELRSLQAELAELVRRSLEQRAAADAIGVRMRVVADEISKRILPPTPPPPPE